MLPVIQSLEPVCPACEVDVMHYIIHGRSGLDGNIYPAFECKSCWFIMWDIELLEKNRKRRDRQVREYRRVHGVEEYF